MKAKLSPILHSLAVALFLLASMAPANAHHSFAADFDSKAPVALTGVVTGVRWANPHALFFMDVKTPDGNVENWKFELGSINMLIRYKFTKNTLKIGETVSVEGYRARDGSTFANATVIKLPDGQVFSAGSSLQANDAK